MKILLIRFGAAGDILLAGEAIRAIKEKGGHTVYFLTKKQHAAIPPLIGADSTIVYNNGGLSGLNRIITELNGEKFDAVVDLHATFRSMYVTFFVKAGNKATLKKDGIKRRLLVLFKWAKYGIKRTADKYIEAIERVTGPLKRFSFRMKKKSKSRKVKIVIHIGARWFLKRWPYFEALAGALAGQKNISIILTGVKEEIERKSRILYMRGNKITNLIGKTSLRELYKTIKEADLFIGNDTAAAHMAVLCGVPAMVLLGPTVQAFGFITAADFMVAEKELACRPCHLHGGNTCMTGSFECMRDLSVKDAEAAALMMLKRQGK